MRYLTLDDLKTDSQERFITDSTAEFTDSLPNIEKRVVAMAITYLAGRYDTDLIFNTTNPIRNEVLVDIIAKITLYKVFRRNAARKVSTDIKDDYDWAMKELDKINAGRTLLQNLPKPPQDITENPNGDSLWGNNSNPDFYI